MLATQTARPTPTGEEIMTIIRKLAGSSVIAAMAASSLTPAYAAPSVSRSAAAGQDSSIFEQASDYRRHRRHRDRVDAGDVIAGIGILAGIAIIASAASKSNKRRDDRRDYPDQQRYPEQRYPDQRYPDQSYPDENYPEQSSAPSLSGDDIGSAVSSCTNAAERRAGSGVRVNEVRSASREGNGWRVSGNLSDNRRFDCGVTGSNVDFVQIA